MKHTLSDYIALLEQRSLLAAPVPEELDRAAPVELVAYDSREVVPGALFAALPGSRADGRAHIPEALYRGAAAVVCAPPLPAGVPGAAVDDPRAALALLAA